MTIKLMGAILICTGCGCFGFAMAASCRAEEQAMMQLHRALEYMSCELSYRMTPLPQLCRNASRAVTGPVSRVFAALAEELEQQLTPDAQCAMTAVLERTSLPGQVHMLFRELGTTLGAFDLPGQLRGMESAMASVESALRSHREHHAGRLRSYQTLSLCVGAALAILLL